MYIHPNPTYYRGNTAIKFRAPFLLLLLQLRKDTTLHAVVRQVALQQFGHWMMGSANMLGTWHVISGAYGNDGLPMTVDHIPKDAIPLPPDIADAYWKGDGWNCAGNEAPALREWVVQQFSYLNHRRAA